MKSIVALRRESSFYCLTQIFFKKRLKRINFRKLCFPVFHVQCIQHGIPQLERFTDIFSANVPQRLRVKTKSYWKWYCPTLACAKDVTSSVLVYNHYLIITILVEIDFPQFMVLLESNQVFIPSRFHTISFLKLSYYYNELQIDHTP